MENNQIIYTLDSNGDRETILKEKATALLTKLKNQFGSSHTVSAGEFGLFDKDWTHEIKIRKGDKIGAEVTLKWEQNNPTILSIDVDESSKMGSMITYGVLLPFVLIGAYLGYNDMEPLAFLPGHKIAGGLGGLIAIIPGAIVVYLLKSMLLKNEKEENKQLVSDVISACKNE
jgi:hypothetical protein